MKYFQRACFLGILVFLHGQCLSGEGTDQPERDKAAKTMKNGNWKDAFESYRKLALDPAGDPMRIPADLDNAVACLQNLGRQDEADELREKAVAAHPDNWRMLAAVAQSYFQTEHHGFIVAGQFSRGNHRGGGKYVNSFARDRIQALQLFQKSAQLTQAERDKNALFTLYQQYANAVMYGGYHEAWRLQFLSDLSQLPDYEEGVNYGFNQGRGAPVQSDGTPVYHKLPMSFDAAASDGERWRWLLKRQMETAPGRSGEIQYNFALFLHQQFDVQTMAYYGRWFGDGNRDDDKKDQSGPFAVKTLGEDETIARLACGIRRFKLPDEFNFIRIFQQVARKDWQTEMSAPPGYAKNALSMLGQIFENRQQYPRAAEYWRLQGNQVKVKQIVGNWGIFESTTTQSAGKGATVDYRYRNGNNVSFTAHEIDVSKLLNDVMAFIKTNPGRQNDFWQKLNIQDLGYRLVQQNEIQYLGKIAANWDLDLTPRENHFDRRITVTTPLQKPGAYLLAAQMADGNTSRVIVWVADTVIVKKNLDKKGYYFVADALSGQPVAAANLQLFGYRSEQRNKENFFITTESNHVTDADGQIFIDSNTNTNNPNFQWLAIARSKEGRFAYLGFSGIWYGQYHDYDYNQTKVFAISDRPVYRPDQPVKFKFWINQAQYDREGASPYSGQTFTVRANNPKGEKIFEKSFIADEFGGLDGELTLDKTATLGQYQICLLAGGTPAFQQEMGSGSFRLEEYKKPEFEVKIVAPSEPMMLGEKIAATITARYYFGAPVTEASVKLKVMRSSYSANWYPAAIWDWFYQPGYWWFSCDYPWYPGWNEWSCCKRPYPWWRGNWSREQPELVMENEVPLSSDGTLKVEIDTAITKAMQGDTDHKYEITAEVTDQSRRTIVGQGSVMVARKPFKVYTWVNQGHYRMGDTIQASFSAQTLDHKPVQGKGEVKLLKVTYDAKSQPIETVAQRWNLDTDDQGQARLQIKAGEKGQYRLSYEVTDAKGHMIEGGYVFCIIGQGFDGTEFRFNDLEIIADKREYKPGEQVQLMLNTNHTGGTIVFFLRPANGVCLPPKIIRLKGKSAVETFEIVKKDMPNLFVEALTIADGKIFTETREIVVPPESRVVNVEVLPSAKEYKPGQKARVEVKLTEANGEPIAGSAVMSIYDKSVEYISGGSNVPEIKSFFWKWRRSHHPQTESSLSRSGGHIGKQKELFMQNLGVFGAFLPDGEEASTGGGGIGGYDAKRKSIHQSNEMSLSAANSPPPAGSPMENEHEYRRSAREEYSDAAPADPGSEESNAIQPTIRKNFADTAYWTGLLNIGANGLAGIELTMPENLTNWKIRTWVMGSGTRVGEGTAEVVTTKNLLLRMQTPRFFTQKDEVVLSANVHNYLQTKKKVEVSLEMDGGCLEPLTTEARTQTIEIEPKGEKRVDWRVKVIASGEAVVRMKALTDEESDAMEMRFPAYIHGISKTESFAGAIRPDQTTAIVAFSVPSERRPEESRLEVRYSPTLAGAMVDALPYMLEYPYASTEHTLNRFLPAVITQNVLKRMGVNLKDIHDKFTNLNAQEIGDDRERAKQWQRYASNPVFNEGEMKNVVFAGMQRLAAMQVSDGGWGWFSGWGEQSYPHTTAYVVHGLQIARENEGTGLRAPSTGETGMLERGVEWLKRYQGQQIQMIKNAPTKTRPWKDSSDNLDALVYMVLADAKTDNVDMREFLYRDRNNLSVYSKSMFGLALNKLGHIEQRDMLIKNVEQFLVQDDENQTAYLKLPETNHWWYWYGSEYEAQAYYLKLLAATDPKGDKGSRLVKYLVNNRKHATYWNSTRDTALCIEALADYLKASGEDRPDLTLQIALDGRKVKEVKIDASNLFTYDNALVLTGNQLSDGPHKLEFAKTGKGPIYFNAYVTNFTLEDHIGKAGLEIKVERKYYKLKRVDKTVQKEGEHGQVLDQKAEKYERQPLANLAELKSGELIEIELEIESKNDYEYILFEDLKAAGFEPVDVRSGYNNNSLGAYMELRDERVCFFVRALARGRHSVSYRMRAEIPGRFSALPTRASAMYAPELKANSDEIKLRIID